MRASWNGYFKVGDVTFPVRLYSGTRSVNPHFVRLHAVDHSPVVQIIKCQKDGKELHAEDIVRAVEVNGTYVEISDKDMQASGMADRNIIVRQFSELDEIDSMYYDKPYFMVPSKGGELAYTVLRQAFLKAKKVAIVTYVLYEKEHLGIVKAYDGMLLLQQLHFADELVSRREIKTPALPQPSPSNVEVATKLMNQYSTSFYVEDYRNEQRDAMNELIERRAKGLLPKRHQQVSPKTTPEDEIIPKLKALLGENKAELSEAGLL